MIIEWTEPAELDLDNIYSYITRDVPIYAKQFIDSILETTLLYSRQNAKPVSPNQESILEV